MAREECPFVLVRAYQDVRVVLFALGEGRPEVVREVPAIDNHAGGSPQVPLNILSGLRAQLCQRLRARVRRDLRAGLFGLGQRHRAADPNAHEARAFRNRAMEQPFGFLGRQHARNLEPAGRLAENRDVSWVAAEARDVLLDPFEGRDGVHQAVVARRVVARFLRQPRVGEPPERPETIVVGDDHGAMPCERFAVITGLRPGAAGEPAAVREHHNGPAIRWSAGRRPDIDEETVLIGRWLRHA